MLNYYRLHDFVFFEKLINMVVVLNNKNFVWLLMIFMLYTVE